MKRVGILTFHSSLNYGGVLQAWALQTIIKRMGYQVWILDRWFRDDNKLLLGPFGHASIRERCSFLIRALLGGGQLAHALRHLRTIQFLKTYLRRTDFHFIKWSDLKGRLLNIETVVVGSDQVWHCGDWGDPRPFLLEGAPKNLGAIAYAASFGMMTIPEKWRDIFRTNLTRFSAVGVREEDGVKLVASVGSRATYVLDPTQLVPVDLWEKSFHLKRDEQNHLFCYFLSVPYEEVYEALERFARRAGCRVDVYVNGPESVPFGLKRLLWRAMRSFRRTFSPVRVHLSAGPKEFLGAISSARWVLTDSFHALMFSSIFSKNIRFLVPKTDERRKMFGRITSFTTQFVSGPLLVDSLTDALESFMRNEGVEFDAVALKRERTRSYNWLEKALKDA